MRAVKVIFSISHILFIVFAISVSFLSCSSGKTEPESSVLQVTVSIPPQAFIVKNIGREKVSVSVMMPPTASPETYEPGPARMAELKNSAVYFTLDVPFEDAFIGKVKGEYPNVRFAEMRKNIQLLKMAGHHHHHEAEEREEHRGHHHHDGEEDPHVWLDPVNLKIMADNCAEVLIAADPGNAWSYRANLADLKNRLDALHEKLKNELAGSEGKAFMIYHPSWGYFANRFGLIQVAVEVDGKEPSAAEMVKIVDFIKENNVKQILSQVQSPEFVVRSIAEANSVQIHALDPLKEDVVENLLDAAAEIKNSLVTLHETEKK